MPIAQSYSPDASSYSCGSSSEEDNDVLSAVDVPKDRHGVHLPPSLPQIQQETVSGVLKRLNSIRQLAGDAQVLRRKEHKEQNTRRLLISQLHNLLVEEAEFNPQAVRQQSVITMLEGIKVQNVEIYFFNADELNKGLKTGPSVKLRDACAKPYRVTDKIAVDLDLLSRMLTQLSTSQILDIVNKAVEYLTFMQTTYQVKPVEEKDARRIKNAAGLAFWGKILLVTDPVSHCIWRVSTSRFTAQGTYEVEVFAGCPGQTGFRNGPLKRSLFSSPMAIVISEQTREAFVADTENHSIRRIDLELETVSHINVRMFPNVPHSLAMSFQSPKGICVVNGDKAMFSAMDAAQKESLGEFKSHLESVGDYVSEADVSSTSAEDDCDDSRSSPSGESTSESGSGSEETSSFESSGTSSSSGDQCMREKFTRAANHRSPICQTRQHKMPGMSLEQSLTHERMRKYTVLADPPMNFELPAQAHSTKTSQCHSVLAVTPSLPMSRRQSVMDGWEKPDTQKIEAEVRLAVTCDHCVWFVNPYSGHARVIAGHPMQYGYCDSANGLQARFSSPKGLVHVRSVLFVADYWNNVIRSVNLFSTQVDSVVDFAPQGPVAITVTESGVLYTLDSDSIHYSNILRIMSTQRNGDGGSISTPAIVEDRMQYQTMFQNPSSKSRFGSMLSDQTSTTKVTELWDSVRRQSITCGDPPPLENVKKEPDDFRSRLAAHLQVTAKKQAVREKEKSRRVLGHGCKTRDKQKKNKKKKKSKKKQTQDDHTSPSDVDSHIDPRLVQDHPPEISISITHPHEEDRSTTPGPSDEINSTSDSFSYALQEQLSQLSSTHDGELEQQKSDGMTKNSSMLAPGSPSKECKSPIPPRPRSRNRGPDHVDVTLLKLMESGTRMSLSGVPKTLGDLGVEEKKPSATSTRQLGPNLNAMMLGQKSKEGYRAIACDAEVGGSRRGSGSDLGTVIVSGGKAFYRSKSSNWAELKQGSVPSSQAASRIPSRRASCVTTTDELKSMRGRLFGEDEEGNTVNFVDLTVERRASIETAIFDPYEDADVDNNRRGSKMTQATALQAMLNDLQSKGAGELSRRNSLLVVRGEGELSRRNSLLIGRGEGDVSRRQSFSFESGGTLEPGSKPASRRGSVSGATDAWEQTAANRRASQRRQSLGAALEFKLSDMSENTTSMMVRKRTSLADRRNSMNISTLPTLVDLHEGDEDEEHSSASSKSDKSKDKNISGKVSANSPVAPEVIEEHEDEDKHTSSAAEDTAQEAEDTVQEDVSNINGSVEEDDAFQKQANYDAHSPCDKSTKSDSVDGSTTLKEPSKDLTNVSSMVSLVPSSSDQSVNSSPNVLSLGQVPFTRDIDVNYLGELMQPKALGDFPAETAGDNAIFSKRSSTVATSYFGMFKVASAHVSKTWRTLPLPEPLSTVERHKGGQRRYPNTPLAIAWYNSDAESFLFVGLLCRPQLLKIIPPKHHEPDKNGRFNVLPIDRFQVLLADEFSHQIHLFNCQRETLKHLAGCGKSGYLDGPLETCRMHSPCSMTFDPRSHYIFVADRGNHVIRKIDLMCGLMSTVVGNGTRGSSDGVQPFRQSLDSPFEVSFVDPHYLIISCADNSIRSFNLKTEVLETILVGS